MKIKWRVSWLSLGTWTHRGLCQGRTLQTLCWRLDSGRLTCKQTNQWINSWSFKASLYHRNDGSKVKLLWIHRFFKHAVLLFQSGSCCLLVWTAGGSSETSSSPTDTPSSWGRRPNTAPCAPSCAACRASRRGTITQHAFQNYIIQAKYN